MAAQTLNRISCVTLFEMNQPQFEHDRKEETPTNWWATLRSSNPCEMFSDNMKPDTRWWIGPASPQWGRRTNVWKPRRLGSKIKTVKPSSESCSASSSKIIWFILQLWRSNVWYLERLKKKQWHQVVAFYIAALTAHSNLSAVGKPQNFDCAAVIHFY